MITESQDEMRARKTVAFLREKHFVDRLNRLGEAWIKLASEYNQKHALNVKFARELSKAFHEVEKEESWPNFCPKDRKFGFLRKAADPAQSCE